MESHGAISGKEHGRMAVHPAQGVQHCVQQAADHGVPSCLSSQANQGALRIGSKEDAFVVRRLVNAGR